MYWSHIYPVYGQFTYNWGFWPWLGSIEEDGFCVSMSANHPVGLWSTLNCSTLNSFICEFPREGFTTPSTTQPTTTLPKPCETGWKEHQGNCYKVHIYLFLKKILQGHFHCPRVNLFNRHCHSSKSDPWATGFRANMDHLGHLWLIF